VVPVFPSIGYYSARLQVQKSGHSAFGPITLQLLVEIPKKFFSYLLHWICSKSCWHTLSTETTCKQMYSPIYQDLWKVLKRSASQANNQWQVNPTFKFDSKQKSILYLYWENQWERNEFHACAKTEAFMSQFAISQIGFCWAFITNYIL